MYQSYIDIHFSRLAKTPRRC